MKKLVLTLALAGLTVGSYAQGTVAFATVGSSGVVQELIGSTATTVGGSAYNGNLTFEIFSVNVTSAQSGVNPDVGTATLGFSLGELYLYASSDYPVPGHFNGGTATFANVVPSTTGYFEVVGWSGSYATWDAAVAANAYVGYSGIFANTTGGGSPPVAPAAITGWNGALLLQQVPEPTTLALGGLGAAALLLFRRRK